jgi:hypothetical protein
VQALDAFIPVATPIRSDDPNEKVSSMTAAIPANSEMRYLTRAEYVALVKSNRPLVRVERDPERIYELLDKETNERFQIRERDLFPSPESR